MATSALIGGMPGPGSEMRIGNYEVEVDREMTLVEYEPPRLSLITDIGRARAFSTSHRPKLSLLPINPLPLQNLSAHLLRLRLLVHPLLRSRLQDTRKLPNHPARTRRNLLLDLLGRHHPRQRLVTKLSERNLSTGTTSPKETGSSSGRKAQRTGRSGAVPFMIRTLREPS